MNKISLSDNPIHWARYVSLKSQRLTQATYLVTSVLGDSEPLKWRLRDISLDILSDTSLLQPFDSSTQSFSDGRHISPIFKATVLESVVVKIDQLAAWLEVALAGLSAGDGNLSGANLAFLRQEYLNFNDLLREKVKSTGLAKLVELSAGEVAPAGMTGSGPTLAPTAGDRLAFKDMRQNSPRSPSDNLSYQKLSRLPHKNRDQAKNSRRGLILEFLKGKDWTSIKDITDAISGCSAKTIQRELADLVHQGVLKKKGDRRWSRYLLG